ncbi:MAG: SDR family NAD(P)-dependent oxidoreductase [Candidatus Rokubacteria bacterium]|nr:SDR family NAD(P)-dependent oxidoreductase [Candidatus Rokubacteria bacterium]
MRIALVTGGGRGIGRECALALARHGFAVAAAARTLGEVERVAGEALGLGARAFAVGLDVADPASVERAAREVVDALGPVDVLVNNAGIAQSAPFGRTDLELWDRHLRVNATGPYLVTRAVLPGMLARGWGRVINVASLAGLHGAPYVSAYVASKHALVGLTRALAAEVAGKGVTVNAICPGYVASDMTWTSARNIVAKTGTSYEDAVAGLARMNPGGRLIEPAEIADVVLRLIEDDRTNGDSIVMDGSTPSPTPEATTRRTA